MIRYITLAFACIFCFQNFILAKTYTLRVLNPSELPTEFENFKFPKELTPKLYENINTNDSPTFQISLPDDTKISVSSTSLIPENKVNCIFETSYELKLKKLDKENFNLDFKYSFAQQKNTCEICTKSESVSTTIKLKLNTPTLIAAFEQISKVKDKTFILGDIPLIGRFFSSDAQIKNSSYILVILSENDDDSASQ